MKKFISVIIILIILFITANSLNEKAIYKNANTDKKTVSLTFDDGPHPKKTTEILDILKKHDVKATFFIIGINAEQHPDIVKRIIDEGHEIGNHTYSHNLKTKKTPTSEIERLDEYINKSFGYKIKLYRPPGGIICQDTKKVSQELDYDVILWNVDTKDWAHKSVTSIKNNVLKNVSCGSIILMHDYITGESNTADALDIIIPELKKEGYQFLTVSELIENKGYTS
jgi:polysaccharide deacetylase family sporulation protein PdaB